MQSLIRNSKILGFGKNKYKDEISELINKKLGILPYIYNGNINNLKDILSEKNLKIYLNFLIILKKNG